MKLVAALALGAAMLAVAAPARADGDPASDFLLTQQIFLPYDAKLPAAKQQQLTAVVAAANRGGYSIRVAVIASSYDLGAITGLWRRPRTYARFLGAELTYVYKRRLLVVMPNGFGFNNPGHPTDVEYALLATIPIGAGTAGLADAAQTAVLRLAAASGVKVVPAHVAAPKHQNSRDRTVIIIGSVAAIAIALLLRLAVRRPRRR